jgi:hypothetical protein
MYKRWTALLVILIIVVPIAYSLTNIIVSETELVAIKPSFEDPDGDVIEYSYSYPLNDAGEWQTSYGDEGNYIATITASDGDLITEEEVIITVNKKEEPPEIYEYYPEEDVISVKEGEDLYFSTEATDLNDDELTYKWYFDQELLGEGQELEYFVDFFDQGSHNIKVVVSDSTLETIHVWAIEVEDLDRTVVLNNITDIEVDETETVSLELPNFEAYGLEYEISEPIGNNNNSWKTGYDNAGEYDVTIKIMDRSFEFSKTIKVKVNNIDREPTLDPVYNVAIKEGEELAIAVSASDPDGDEITFYVDNAPEGSTFDDNVFVWTPDNEFAKKTNFFTYLLDKFHLLNKAQAITFVAESNELSASRRIKIRVYDTNRLPVIEDMGPIIVNEGETLFIEPNAYDLDGDKISYKFWGWTDNPSKETGYEDAGTYTAFIRVTDGKSSIEKNVTIIVNDVNRPPVIYEIPSHDVNEGGSLQFSIGSDDPDEDVITTSVENAPTDSSLDGNVFSWEPGYEETETAEAKEYTLNFMASDGRLNASTETVILVHNTNRAPEVLEFTPTNGYLNIFTNTSVLFQVNAQDPDGDDLNYEWVFGRFDKFEGSPVHNRWFMFPGKKEVILTISDGDYAMSVKWFVNVVEPVQQVALSPTVVTAPTPAPAPQPAPVPQPAPAPVPPPLPVPPPTPTYKTYVVTENV